jgi:hypothetical protein
LPRADLRDSDSFFENKMESDVEQKAGGGLRCANPPCDLRPRSDAAARMSQRVEHGMRATQARSKRVVKNWLALICTIPIRSLRTKWSRMENKAVVLFVSLTRQSIGYDCAGPTA